jgi:hypothetical protein
MLAENVVVERADDRDGLLEKFEGKSGIFPQEPIEGFLRGLTPPIEGPGGRGVSAHSPRLTRGHSGREFTPIIRIIE